MRVTFPESPEQVLEIIVQAEHHRKYVWTVGRVLERAALWTKLQTYEYSDRKAIRGRIENCLNKLAADGVLSRRPDIQTIGYGEEIGFDYVTPKL